MLLPQWRQAGLVAGLVLLLLPVFVHAQAVGSLTGRVVDATGGVIPGVEVTITSDVAGGDARARSPTRTASLSFATRCRDGTGCARSLEGFKAFNRDLVVTAGAPIRLEVALEVGPVAAWTTSTTPSRR